MTEELPQYPPEPERAPQTADIGRVRRFGRRVLGLLRRRGRDVVVSEELSPHVIVASDAEEETGSDVQQAGVDPIPLGEPQGRTVVVTLVDGLNALEFTEEGGEAVHAPIRFRRRSADRLLTRLGVMYLSAGEGEHAAGSIAHQTGFQETTVVGDARQLARYLPKEIFDFEQRPAGNARLWFGKLALAARKPDAQDIAELDRDKVDLTVADHAIITNGTTRYYVPFDSSEAILAVRVVEALQGFDRVGATTENVTRAVWRNMTIAERQLFLDDLTCAFSDSPQVEDEVLAILRKLTNRLMLTLEPRGEQFTVHSSDLTVEIHDSPIDVRAHPDARPVSPPGQEIIIKLLPSHLDQAREALEAVRAGQHLEHEEAIQILDFVTSAAGRRAIIEVFTPMEGAQTPVRAIKAIHRLLRLSLGDGYAAARRSRTISGGRIIRSKGAVRQVGGRLPSTTKWHIGRPIGETYER